MKSKIVKKGAYGYIENHKAVTALRTMVFILMSVGMYVMGYL